MVDSSRRNLLTGLGGVALFGAAILARPAPLRAGETSVAYNAGPGGLMLKGYDPVAYFQDDVATKGDPSIQTVQEGLIWQFASAANRDAFLADPARYQPAYGGYCAMGTALERKLDGDPEVWRIADGRLFLNVNKDVQKRWVQDISGNVRTADANWPKIKDVPAAELN